MIPSQAASVTTTGSAPSASQRIRLLDFCRGIALIEIFLAHLPSNPLHRFLWPTFGFSDAAAVFVFISGFVSHEAYRRMWERKGAYACVRRSVERTAGLYFWHVVMSFFALAVIVYLWRSQQVLVLFYEHLIPVHQSAALYPEAAIRSIFTLSSHLFCTDILPLYIVLVPLTVPAFWALRHYPRTLVAVSLGLWLFFQVFTAHQPGGLRPEVFNPLAWQMLFVLGMFASKYAGRFKRRSRRASWVYGAAIGMLVLSFVVRQAELLPSSLGGAVALFVPTIAKVDLGWVYLGHALLTFYVFARALPAAGFARWKIAPLIERMGRHSLPIFVFSTIFTYSVVVVRGSDSYLSKSETFVVVVIGLYAVHRLAVFFDSRRRQSAKINQSLATSDTVPAALAEISPSSQKCPLEGREIVPTERTC